MFIPMAAPLRTSAEHPPHFHPGAALLAEETTKAAVAFCERGP